ncbi:zinc finger, CCHC-type containing protein, partial [Tanacetum coccineum]
MTKESGDTSKKEVSTTSTPQFQCPILKPSNYSLWAIRMQIILEANGLWEMIEPLESTQADNKKDKTAIAFLYQALPEEQLLQITKHKTAKAIWNALKTRHIGEERVQQARLQTLKSDFELLHMKEDETIDTFTGKLTTLVNKAASLGHTMEDETLVRKLLNAVPDRYLQIVASIEQYSDLSEMTLEEAIGRLKTYEERIKYKRGKQVDSQESLMFTRHEDQGQQFRRRGHGGFNQSRGQENNFKKESNSNSNKFTHDKSKVLCFKCKEIYMIDHNNEGGSNQKNMINLDLRKITTMKVEVTEEKNDLPRMITSTTRNQSSSSSNDGFNQKMDQEDIQIEFISGEYQKADILTKALPKIKFLTMRQLIGLKDLHEPPPTLHYSVSNRSKFPLTGLGLLTRESGKRKQNISNVANSPESVITSCSKQPFPKLTVSPLRKFQLIDSDYDSNIPSIIRKDLWEDFRHQKSFHIPTPALDEVCEEYFSSTKEKRKVESNFGKSNHNSHVMGSAVDLGDPRLPAHQYFFHNDLRVQELVRTRLCNFFSLNAKSRSSERPKDGQGTGHWFTNGDVKRVYASKNGQEMTGKAAYIHYKKESGGGFKNKKAKKTLDLCLVILQWILSLFNGFIVINGYEKSFLSSFSKSKRIVVGLQWFQDSSIGGSWFLNIFSGKGNISLRGNLKMPLKPIKMVSLTITFYHEGVFVGPPLEYLEGNKDTMKDLDFGNFTYGKFFECIKAATLFPPVGLFYCLPGSDLSDGIRELKNEQQLADFVATALGNGGHIDVYVEHHGYDIHDWFAKDNDDLEDYDEDECVLDDISSFVEEPQFIGEEEVIIPNRCTSDPFLNRLCKTDPKKTTRNTFGTNERNENALALVEDEQEDQSVDPIYKIKPGIVYPDHDPDQHWKDMVPILGMKFKDHEEMKMMLANYGVANGYQLWYKRNDYKSLLVLCGRNVEEGRCASKVGRKGIQKNVSKASKGKEKVEEGKGKEKVVVGNKKWTKQAIKLSKSPSKKGTKRKTSDNLCKFRLWGSWMQNEASFQIKTLIPDHNCARVFDFGALVTYKWIARHYVREILRGLTDIITPSVRKQLEKLKEYLRLWEVYPSGYREFEVRKLNAGFGVNLETHKCTCRLWDLTGIPCIHGVAAYAYLMKDVQEPVQEADVQEPVLRR